MEENNENKIVIQKGGEWTPGAIAGTVIGVIAAAGVVTGYIYYKKTQNRIKQIKKEILKQIKKEMDEIRLKKRKEEYKREYGEKYKKKWHPEDIVNDTNLKLINNINNWEDNIINTKKFALNGYIDNNNQHEEILTVITHDIIFLTVNDVALDLFYKEFEKNINDNEGEIDADELDKEIMEEINKELPRRLHYPCIENGAICSTKNSKGVQYIEIMRKEFNNLCGYKEVEKGKIQKNALDEHKLEKFISIKPGKKGFPTLWDENKSAEDENKLNCDENKSAEYENKSAGECDFKKIFNCKVADILCETINKIKNMNFDDMIISTLSGNKKMTMKKYEEGNATNVCKNILYLKPVDLTFDKSVSILKNAKMKLSGDSIKTIKDETCSNLVKSLVKDIANKIKDEVKKSLQEIDDKYNCSDEDGSNVQEGGAVISKGSYGCIFKPAISCSTGKNIKSKKYISKLMLNEPFLNEREMRISKIIKQIPNYHRRYSPILSLCDIEIKNIKDKDIKKCDEIIKHGKKYQPVIGKVRLINGKDLYENYKSKPKKKFQQFY